MDYFDGPFVLVPTQTFVTRVVAYRRFGSMDTLMMVCFLFTAAVREKLMVDRDSEISATSLRVSLLCPVQSLYFILKRGKEEEGWRKEGRRKGGHYRENRYQYVHVCDDCVFVVSVSNEEEFAEQKLCVVDQSGVDKRDPGRRGREGEREGGREGGREGVGGGGRRRGREGGEGERKEGWGQ